MELFEPKVIAFVGFDFRTGIHFYPYPHFNGFEPFLFYKKFSLNVLAPAEPSPAIVSASTPVLY